RGRAHPRPEPEFLGALTGDERDDPRRLHDVELHLGEKAVHGHRAHDAGEPVACADAVEPSLAAQALDFGGRDDAMVRSVALDSHLAGAIPAAQGVEADPKRTGGLARCVRLLRHDNSWNVGSPSGVAANARFADARLAQATAWPARCAGAHPPTSRTPS